MDRLTSKIQEESQPELQVFGARSTLLIPMTPRRHNAGERPLEFYSRDYELALTQYEHKPHPKWSKGKVIPKPSVSVWSSAELNESPLQEVNELTPALRDFLRGCGEEEMKLRCLELNNQISALTFQRLKLKGDSGELIPIKLNSVKLYIYPLNTMILTIDISWDKVTRVDALFSALDMCRHLKSEKKGWVVPVQDKGANDKAKHHRSEPADDHEQKTLWDELVNGYREEVGEDLFKALRHSEGEPVSMSSLLEFILKPIHGEIELLSARYAQHHTSLVLDVEPDEAQRTELLFRLRRGYGQAYIPPRRPAQEFSEYKRERAFEVRGNRWVTIAREGTGSLSWLTGDTDSFAREWPNRWAGVYCLLALQAISEQVTLARLELAAASVIERFNARREELKRGRGELSDKQIREDVQDLTFLMARYSLTTSADESGGVTDYADFFSNLRVVMRTPSLRAGLRQDLQEVLGLVELIHNEQEMKIERDISRFGLWLTPVLIATAYFGMNNEDLPKLISHQWVIGGIVCCVVGWLIHIKSGSKR